jgi:serine/threonine protein kinase/Tfp pilus assembly protein PilF
MVSIPNTFMTPERWVQIKRVFHEALERDPVDRAAFLVQVCGTDTSIREQVEALIASHAQASDFIETPASDLAAALLVEERSGLTAGQALGPFTIKTALAKGGMGQVYLAEDTRLGRPVALKLLPTQFTSDPDRVSRFEQEARAASALNHPNIVTIHEIGQADSLHFIATEFVSGKTVREHLKTKSMTVGEVLDVAVQIAAALEAAHEAGIVHRDIKPENIMVRRDSVVKVLDFGLAKLMPQEVETVETTVQTHPGVVMGTAAYMSPEQARGNDVDARTDIWSLGVVLYEMVTGRAPFTGETQSHVIVSILESQPTPLSVDPEVPQELDRIVSKALCKERRGRYQSTVDILRDLKNLKEELTIEARLKQFQMPITSGKLADETQVTARARAATTNEISEGRSMSSTQYLVERVKRHKALVISALVVLVAATIGLRYSAFISKKVASVPVAGVRKSIAVLPPKPINAGSRDETYEFAIADALINRLNSTNRIVVQPLNATNKYADVEQDPVEAGREQQVDLVLESHYQVADGKIRITAQLFNVATGHVEDAYSSDQQTADFFAMLDAVANDLGAKVMLRFSTTSSSHMAKRGTANPEAYRLYLQGRNLLMKRSSLASQKAVEYFKQAIQLDPAYAKAYAGLARAYPSSLTGPNGIRVENEKVRENIRKALELDGSLAEAYVARADLALKFKWDFPAVERDVLRAIELEPNNDAAHWLYALLFVYRGRFDEALTEIEIAQTIDPSALMYMRDRARVFYYDHRYDEAIVQLKRVIDLDEDFETAYSWLWQSYELKGDYAAAYESFIEWEKKRNPSDVAAFQKAYKTAGWRGFKLKLLELRTLNERSPEYRLYDAAETFALLGEKDRAFEYLNKAVETRQLDLIMLNVDPTLDSLRNDPRFQEIVRRVGLR